MRKTSDAQMKAVKKNDIDLTGKRFGELLVLRNTGEKKRNCWIWECQCDCGNKSYPIGWDLLSGHSKSCGCAQTAHSSKTLTLPLVGKRFGKLVVVQATDRRMGTSVIWECKCDCGNTTYVPTGSLTSGRTRSCGCLMGRNKDKSIVGKRFGKLVVLRETEQRKKSCILWECQCDCGNTVLASTSDLERGSKKSCGCLKYKDISGQRFGMLVAIRATDKRKKGYVVWECQCDCGNLVNVAYSHLTGGKKKSCGCLAESRSDLSRRVLEDDITLTIKDLRIAANMTQAEFSTYFDIPKRTIEDWETGRRKFPQYLLPLIRYKLVSENLIN